MLVSATTVIRVCTQILINHQQHISVLKSHFRADYKSSINSTWWSYCLYVYYMDLRTKSKPFLIQH